MIKATKKEIAWCKRLEKVLAAHPKGLWLFAGDGELNVMKIPKSGNVHKDPGPLDYVGTVDPKNSIHTYPNNIITADGGGW